MDFDLGAAGFSGVLLAGGTAARMDGIDKASIELGGRTLLEICLDAFLDADEVVVVGPRTVRTTRPVTFTVEDPPRGGPVAGLLTGVDALLRPARLIGVLAVDMPRVSAPPSAACARRRPDTTAPSCTTRPADASCAACSTPTRWPGSDPISKVSTGWRIRTLLADLDLAEVAAGGDEARDIDTWTDLRDLDE